MKHAYSKGKTEYSSEQYDESAQHSGGSRTLTEVGKGSL